MGDSARAREPRRAVSKTGVLSARSRAVRRGIRTKLLHPGARESELSVTRTSGSSGIPLLIRHSKEENLIHAHFKKRTLLEVGLVPRGVLATVILNLEGEQRRTPGASFERVIVDCRQDREKILKRLIELNPTTLGGYPGTLCHLAESERTDLLTKIRPALAVLGGEVVSGKFKLVRSSASHSISP